MDAPPHGKSGSTTLGWGIARIETHTMPLTHSRQVRAHALVSAAVQRSDKAASRDLQGNVSDRTVAEWRERVLRGEDGETAHLAHKLAVAMAEEYEDAAIHLLRAIFLPEDEIADLPPKVREMKGRDLMISSAVATDKSRLLRGLATTISQAQRGTQAPTADEIAQRIAELRAQQSAAAAPAPSALTSELSSVPVQGHTPPTVREGE